MRTPIAASRCSTLRSLTTSRAASIAPSQIATVTSRNNNWAASSGFAAGVEYVGVNSAEQRQRDQRDLAEQDRDVAAVAHESAQ